MVLSWNSWNWPLTKRSTKLDLPTADSPSSTSLNWQILFATGAPLGLVVPPPRPAIDCYGQDGLRWDEMGWNYRLTRCVDWSWLWTCRHCWWARSETKLPVGRSGSGEQWWRDPVYLEKKTNMENQWIYLWEHIIPVNFTQSLYFIFTYLTYGGN